MSSVEQHYTTLKHLKHWRKYCAVVTGVCGMRSDSVCFGLLSHVPWDMYPKWLSSNACLGAN